MRPPKILDLLLQWIVEYKDRESLTGDFEELYRYKANQMGTFRAALWYIIQLLKLIPITIIESIAWSLVMLLNYIKIAIRNIVNQKMYSFINITGLAIGMAVCILIILYVKEELSYDNYHEHSDSIVRLERQWIRPDGSIRSSFSSMAPSFIPVWKERFPEFEKISRFFDAGESLVSFEENKFIEKHFFWGEPEIFEIFTIPFIEGDPRTALTEPNTVLLTQTSAEKYFGNDSPIGKQIEVDNKFVLEVVGVIEDIPFNSHVHFNILASYITLKGVYDYGEDDDYFHGATNFTDNVTFTYARLAPNTIPDELEAKLRAAMDDYVKPYTDESGKVYQPSEFSNIGIRKVADIHLKSHTLNELESNSDIVYVTIFTIIAAFILIIACVNFINLSTARSAKRAKEVGMKKVIGVQRRSIASQFIGESMTTSFISLLLSIAIIFLILPSFNSFSGSHIELNFFGDISILFVIAIIFLSAGLLAGIYPAIYLSAFNPIIILRGTLTQGKKGTAFRKGLVILQFAISITLIVSVILVYMQMSFVQNKDLGFNKENVVMLPANKVLQDSWQEVQNDLYQNPNVLSASLSKRAPSGGLWDSPGVKIEKDGTEIPTDFGFPHNRVGFDFFKTYGMELIAGRDFSRDYSTDDTEAFIINETAIKKMNIDNPEDILGAKVITSGREGYVIGVVKDFHYESLHKEVVPILSYIRYRETNTVSVRIAPGNTKETMSHIETVIDKYNPGYPVEYNFLDDRLDKLYRNELKMMELIGFFSLFAIFIACLGLFGLASFTAEQRTKEIGIRKTLGASILKLVMIQSKEFLIWVIIANIIAWPVAYYFMSGWLDNFAYRIDLNLLVFAISALLVILVAFFTISYQTLKVAKANPVHSLRYE